MLALAHEFDEMREKSSDIECWNAAFWDSGLVHLTDWYLVDAWYRSRVLELPKSGPSLVPCIDMANHSNDANAYYEENFRDEVILLLRPGSNLEKGGEVTISYGSEKSAAEMLFSYGFIDEFSTARSLRIPLGPLPDDPLAKAKAHIFDGSPAVEINEASGTTVWTSAFAYLSVLNEEDGLGFRILQDEDGGRELRMFWEDKDVSDKSDSFETLISDHELCDVFKLRVNMVVYQRVQEQLDSMSLPVSDDSTIVSDIDNMGSCNAANARTLRRIEIEILEKAITILENQRRELLALESVTAYLGSMGVSEGGSGEDQEADDEFS
ncbi:SET domain-containing protein 8 [Cytospora mali]|nr:SET domain-containing protein 8 [Valsa mali var. pyri (nom. inval.)]